MAACVDQILSRCGLESGPKRWTALRLVFDANDLRQFEDWIVRYRLLRQEALAENTRHRLWMEQQLYMVQALSAIMSGSRHSYGLTYGPEGRIGDHPRLPRYRKEVL